MYRQILVALDGSELAERILPYVQPLAERFDATITLVRITQSPAEVIAETTGGGEPIDGALVDPMPIVEAEQEAAEDYLSTVAAGLRSAGLKVQYEEPEGPPADALLQRADELEIDLIAMATHGRGGLQRLVFGSVADEVLRHANCPVLLVRVDEDHPASDEAEQRER